MFHQGDRRFRFPAIQCTAIAACGGVFSVSINRSIFTADDIDMILNSGDSLYSSAFESQILHQVGSRYLCADDLPTEIRVCQHLIKLDKVSDNWTQNGLYPTYKNISKSCNC